MKSRTKSLSRRAVIQGLAVVAGVAGAPINAVAQAMASDRAASVAAWKARIDQILKRGSLPIIDVEATYQAGQTNVAKMIGFMNELDVAQIVFAPANAPDSSPSLSLQRDYPAHIIPAANSGEFPRWWTGPEKFVDGVARDLKTGRYFIMGEHEFRHYPSPEQVASGNSQRDVTVDLTGAAGQALFKLSEETGLAFQIHYEIEDRLLPALEGMLARYPRAKVIWCHLAMIRYPNRSTIYNPDYVSGLIEKFPNLHFDLATPQAQNVYKPSGAHDGTLYDIATGNLRADWRAVLEKHPDRFVAASDYRPPTEQYYPLAIGAQRRLLSQLSPIVQNHIAFMNAWRLITGAAWA